MPLTGAEISRGGDIRPPLPLRVVFRPLPLRVLTGEAYASPVTGFASPVNSFCLPSEKLRTRCLFYIMLTHFKYVPHSLSVASRVIAFFCIFAELFFESVGVCTFGRSTELESESLKSLPTPNPD